MMTEPDIELIRHNRCPRCKNWGFIPGPRGGAGQNLFCANPDCRAAFMVAPRHNIALAEEIGKAPEWYYPPRVHILDGGFALCNFTGPIILDAGPPPRMLPPTPDTWPIGHSWVGREDFEQCTCTACRQRARS